MKSKKAGYNIYGLTTVRAKKEMLKAGMKRWKKAKIAQIAGEIFYAEGIGDLDKHVFVAETLWEHGDRSVLFPGDAGFYRMLLRSNFALDGSAHLNLPYSTFIIAMPRDFEFDGVKIPSVMVNYNKGDERNGRYDLATKLMGVPNVGHAKTDMDGKDSLSFFYNDPYGMPGIVVGATQTPEQVAGALQSQSANEYADILGMMPKDQVSEMAMEIADTDKVIQFVITKLIAGISVYLSANNITELADGLPKGGRAAIGNLKKDIKYTFRHIPFAAQESKVGDETMTTRVDHFRQLRAPVYYQNEYADLAIGSRWVYVKAAIVGGFKAEHIKTT